MRTLPRLALTLALALSACSQSSARYPTTSDETLKLTRVFLYRNGIGYFEREGHVEGDIMRIKVRKDQINDLLKSLTVVNRKGGHAVSISMPLDPQTWANAALATLAPGRGNLAQVLDALRGTQVTLTTSERSISGRIVMVEEIEEEAESTRSDRPAPIRQDHRITLLDGGEMKVARLSKIQSVEFQDGDLAMQFHRSLDASAGEGMFQQVEVSIRLAGAREHDLAVSYVVPAPMWKPTYRVVLPKEGKGKALLQGWAVVDNTSGEDWRNVRLGLTSGAPIAFRYDLHTPRDVERSDLTETGVRKRAAVAMGETTYREEPAPPPPPPPPSPVTASPAEESVATGGLSDGDMAEDRKGEGSGYGRGVGGGARPASKPAPARRAKDKAAAPKPSPTAAASAYGDDYRGRYPQGSAAQAPAAPPPAVDMDSLRRSTLAQARAAAVSGLTRFDIDQQVTVPDGSSTMVAVINQEVEGEETFLFRPGGAGVGYETNPYRVVRFRNSTPFVLESGPIAIYAGGSFVGEGISESVGSGTSATIPFAVETGIMVTSTVKQDGDEMRLLRILRGVLEVESFSRKTTVWNAKSQIQRGSAFSVLVRHAKAGYNYELVNRAKGTEDLPDAYLLPIEVPQGRQENSITVVEQTPSRFQMSIWENRAIPLLEKLLVITNVPEARQLLEPIVKRRQEIGRLDSKIEELKKQQIEIDQRASETRHNLDAIKKDAAAAPLRARLSKRLEDFAKDGDRIGREIVELQNKRMELRIELEDSLQTLDFKAPAVPPPGMPAVATPPGK